MFDEYFTGSVFIDVILFCGLIYYVFTSEIKEKKRRKGKSIRSRQSFGWWSILIEDYKKRKNKKTNRSIVIDLLIIVLIFCFVPLLPK